MSIEEKLVGIIIQQLEKFGVTFLVGDMLPKPLAKEIARALVAKMVEHEVCACAAGRCDNGEDDYKVMGFIVEEDE
jgi:hypothetical protein